jgi:hypothetical protein
MVRHATSLRTGPAPRIVVITERWTPSASGWPSCARRATLGPVRPLPQRARVGHRPRGLLRGRRRLGLLPARARPQPRLPLERGRPARHLRRPAAPLPRPRPVERPRRILKERLFGVTGPQGNHGEDVKECYWYLDSTPTHSYMRALLPLPAGRLPLRGLVAASAARDRDQPELELADTGVFAEDRFFDVDVEYAKATPDDLRMRITVVNHGPDPAPLHVLPTLWFRNTWSWGHGEATPALRSRARPHNASEITSRHRRATRARRVHALLRGRRRAPVHHNESNAPACGAPRTPPRTSRTRSTATSSTGERGAVDPAQVGTKAAARYASRSASGAPARPARASTSAWPLPRLPTPRPASRRTPFALFELRRARGRRVLRRAAPPGSLGADERRSCARRSPACCGTSSSITTSSATGSTATPASRRRRGPQARATATGAPVQRARHVDARQVGVPVVRRLGPRLPLHPAGDWSTSTSPSASSTSWCASGTCTPTARSRPTSGTSAT